jgi:hypothetical protein
MIIFTIDGIEVEGEMEQRLLEFLLMAKDCTIQLDMLHPASVHTTHETVEEDQILPLFGTYWGLLTPKKG